MQTINLYDAIKVHYPKNLKRLANWLVYYVLFMIIFAAGSGVTWFLKNKAISDMQQTRMDQVNRLSLLTQQNAANQADQRLVSESKRLKEELSKQTLLVSLLDDGTRSERTSLHAYLNEFAEVDVEPIWFHSIYIAFPGPEVAIQGWVKQASVLPNYITSLDRTEYLSALGFKVFDIKRDEQGPIRFKLATDYDNQTIQ